MKNNNRRDNNSSLTTFGVCLFVFLLVLEGVSSFLLIGLTGSFEQNRISFAEYAIGSVICLAVLGLSVYVHKKIFD